MKVYVTGSRVRQATYGPGTVTSSDERYTVIEFDDSGRRMFITNKVALEHTDEPEPVRPVKAKRRKAAPRAAAAAVPPARGN